MNDCTIIKKLKQDKEKALEILIERYSSYVIAVASRIGGHMLNAQDVEEIASDVFYSLWKNRHSLNETDSLKPYIAQISRNMTRKKMLKSRSEETLDEDFIEVHTNDVADQILSKEKIDFIRSLLDQIKHPDRDILIAYYFWNFKISEISDRLKIPLSTVKSKLYRGKKELVTMYEKGGYYE